MTQNPLRDLLTRMIYDKSFDLSKCIIEYRDYDVPNKTASVNLVLCRVESRNLLCGDAIIPFHRIRRVLYDGKVIYPQDKDSIEPGR